LTPVRAKEKKGGAWLPRALLTAALGVCAGLVIVSRQSPGDLSNVRQLSNQAAAPVSWLYQVPIDTVATIIDVTKSYLFVRDRNELLKSQVVELATYKRRVERLELENEAYRRQLSAVAWPSQLVATGRVLSHGGGTYLKSILLAAGSDDQVEAGQAVVSHAGLVGQVVSTASRLSRVLLINDFSSRIPVVIDETATPGILVGTNEPLLKLSFLPIDFEGKQGARVSTSGAGGLFPAGLPIGRLIIKQDGGKPVYALEPYADLTANGILTVLKPQSAEQPPAASPLPTQLVDPALSAQRDMLQP
jgi:rod shape-determining protein MreC